MYVVFKCLSIKFCHFIRLLNLAIFVAEILLKCMLNLATLFAQLRLQFYSNQFETLQGILLWSEDVHVVLALSSI